ncbi:MAG TPA: hypothetical protein VFJ58_04050 [Armatimonadota bacterium]|nr:hypothetical protein [Armatimonadota bacterium]
MDERFSCVAVTRRGLMPGVVVGVDDEGLIRVQALHSDRVYSFPDDAILTPEEGYRLMEMRRVQKVAHEYQFEELNDSPRVVKCCNPHHPRRSNYILSLGRMGWTCTCEAFRLSRRRHCKHISAWMELERLSVPDTATYGRTGDFGDGEDGLRKAA